MTLKEMMAALAAKKTAARAKLATFNALEAKGDARTAEEATQYEALDTELTAMAAEVEALQAKVDKEEASKRRGALFAAGAVARPAYGAAAREFSLDPAATGGFKSISQFGLAVVMASTGQSLTDGRLSLDATASGYMQNQGGAGEGYLAPPAFSQTVWDLALDATDLLSMTNPEPTQANALFKPKDETTPWGAAGIQALWRSEASQMTPSSLSLTGEMMILHELYAFCSASSEVLADAPLLQSRLTTQSGRAIGWKASDVVVWGSGSGQPTGIMNSPALITTAADAAQATATISVSNLANMLKSVLRMGGKPIWIANPDIIPQLIQLTIGNMPAYLPSNQPLAGDPFDGALLGYPIKFTEHAQTLGTKGDLICANMNGYYAATKSGPDGGVQFASSMHLYFDQNLTAFRWTFRMAGQPILSKPVAAARSATSKSHFVTLAARP